VADHAAFMRSRDALREVLLAASKERGKRPELTASPAGGTECAWTAYERSAMLAEVNSQIVHLRRAVLHREMATPEAIARAEREAEGHIDYVDKWSLYCAEIVAGYRDPQTGAQRRG
jgi:hypothetical protein